MMDVACYLQSWLNRGHRAPVSPLQLPLYLQQSCKYEKDKVKLSSQRAHCIKTEWMEKHQSAAAGDSKQSVGGYCEMRKSI